MHAARATRLLRSAALALALSISPLALAQSPAASEPPGATLRIEAPSALPLGAARIEVVVRPPLGPTMPLLLTVRVDGEALQAVRARFLRADARLDRDRRELHFEVPVLGRAPGIAMLRAEVSTYRCSTQSCQPVRVEAARQVRVLGSKS